MAAKETDSTYANTVANLTHFLLALADIFALFLSAVYVGPLLPEVPACAAAVGVCRYFSSLPIKAVNTAPLN